MLLLRAVFLAVDPVDGFSGLHHVEFVAGDDREVLHVGLQETLFAFVVAEAFDRLQMLHFEFRRALLKLLRLIGLR